MNRKTRRLTNANHNAHGLYFHSSVPKVYPHAEDFGKIQYEFNKNVQSKANALVIKPSNIRIWIHDKDIDKLMRVVLEGHGQKLRNEMASTPKVKRFLSYVPHFMGVIKSIHAAVIENNIELVRAKTSPPVPPQMLNCKDVNGLTPLHKAAGLGHTKIVEYLIETWPNLMHETDNNGKTALHYAAAAKNNDRTFNLLVQAGSDELAMDVKGRNAAFYKKGKNGEEIDRSLLTVIPDAARVSEQGFPPSFSWDFLPAKFFDAPIKATQSHMNLSAHTESHMKQSNSAFEIISRTESVDDVNDNEPIKEEEFKVVDEAPIMTAKDLNNNSAKVSRSPERQEEDFEAEEEKTNLTDTETLFSEQKLNGKFNHQDIDDDEQMDEYGDIGSPSPPFEGVIKEEAEKQLESNGSEFEEIKQDSDEPQDEVQKIINAGDMEELAVLVLNGDGSKLVGRKSSQPDIQAFLENIPLYMVKIRKVHLAAREGSLRDLQAALDRRKFSTAKDESSPKGASPLHVAIIFGHTAIIRYLGSRFPETVSAADDENRTSLHYAATLNDNGHFYNLLVTLGADSKAVDSFGHTPEFYLNHDESDKILSHKDLLRRFGAAETLADEMLNDQVADDYHSARRRLDDPDVLSTLERCYRLIHDKRASMLDQTVHSKNGSFPGSASSLRVSVTTHLAKFLKRSVFEKVKYRQTRLDHNLFDVIWPAMKKSSNERRIDEDLHAGVVAPDFDVYVVFQEFFVPLIKDMHGLNQKDNFREHPKMEFFPPISAEDNLLRSGNKKKLKDIQWNLDPNAKWISSTVIECCRNLEEFELPLNLTIGKIEQCERALTAKLLSKEFANAIKEDGLGQYYTMNEVLENSSDIRTILATSGLLIPLLDHLDTEQIPESQSINGPYYPYGRGVYISASRTLVAWINVQEHLRVMTCSPLAHVGDIGVAYSKLGRAMIFLEQLFNFRHSFYLGYLTSRPSFLGTALRISGVINLPHLIKDPENLRQLCLIRNLHMKTRPNFASIIVSNSHCMSTTEWNLLQEFNSAVENILKLESEKSDTNSMHIATMMLKIFRKKKNSLVND